MRHLVLHNPSSQAHLEDLQDRLAHSLTSPLPQRHDTAGADALIQTVTQVVRAMDAGLLSFDEVRSVLSSFHLPGFSIERWMDEMIEEGVYLEEGLAQAA
jgi:hypothetical protein